MRGLVTTRKFAICAVAVAAALLLTVGADAKGKPLPVMFRINLDDMTVYPVKGTFELSGALEGSGEAFESFTFSPDQVKGHPVAHGEKRLVVYDDDDEIIGEIFMKFNVRIFTLDWTLGLKAAQVGIGTWIIESGTGIYDGLRGSGTAYVEVYIDANMQPTQLLAWYTGTVQ